MSTARAATLPFPSMSFIRDELQAPTQGKRRQRYRNFWSVSGEGNYSEGIYAGHAHALELVAVLRRGATNVEFATLGFAMSEAVRRGEEGTFQRGVLVGFCSVLSKALSCPQASVDELADRVKRDRSAFERAMAEEGASA